MPWDKVGALVIEVLPKVKPVLKAYYLTCPETQGWGRDLKQSSQMIPMQGPQSHTAVVLEFCVH